MVGKSDMQFHDLSVVRGAISALNFEGGAGFGSYM